MQNDSSTRQQSFLPDRSMTYSTASSFYARESTYDFAGSAPAPATLTAAGTTGARSTPSIQFPKPEILLGNYAPSSLASRNGGPTSPPAQKRRKASLSDPVLTHLLLQTALGDSGDFEILSLDELEALKREGQSLRARISGLQRKLALETKVRDAAKSLVRLRSTPSSATSSPKFNRRSSNIAKESQDRAQLEYEEAEKKCDALARELYSLEQRERQVQTRILQHTAGILQMTHHGYTKTQGMPFLPGARPDSPASLDGTQPRNLNGAVQNYDALMFNDPSPYDNMLESLNSTPPKQQPLGRLSADTSAQQREMLGYLANGLEDLNTRVAAVLARTNTQKAQKYGRFPEIIDDAVNVSLAQRLDQLAQGLDDIEAEQKALQQEAESRSQGDDKQVAQLQAELQASIQENMALQKEYDRIEDSMSAQLAEINSELYQVMTAASLNVAKAPADSGPMDSLEYTKAQLANVKNMVQASSKAANEARQVDAMVQGLWAFILGAEEDLRDRKRKEREQLAQKRAAGARVDSEDEISDDEDVGAELGETFTMQAFNAKVQWLVSQSLQLKESQSDLKRKIKAHRERADRSLESQAGNDGLREQLNQTNALYAAAQDQLRDLESRIAQLQSSQDEKDARLKALQDEIAKADMNARNEARQESKVEIEVLEQQLKDAQGRAAAFEQELAAAQRQREVDLAATDEAAKQSEAEMQELRDEVVRLKTELTIAQAELDGAYGSRSERAAETAAAANTEASKKLEAMISKNAELTAQIADLQRASGERESQLKKELADTLKEFEELTKVSVEQERERDELESTIDKYRDRIESLEAQIAEDQVKWLGFVGDGGNGASPGSNVSGPSQSMSVMVLKNEFKKMMRDARTESAKQLRAEQDERRRLEGIIRNMKKGSVSRKGSLTNALAA
ncbi:uncharacterized protein PV09_06555 [Verruconis gallopava]|uniref:Uncharacterized protein n=1 Tax=Verruconis gallopava TaxID=253628 RepID=A0A0D2A693_9PEZI|nr:uncharacterized protein PV09_06555 [Verruconis gallopava]KIW02055.1 hypothetical protein PV09_06555 [Verruconis gallopava]